MSRTVNGVPFYAPLYIHTFSPHLPHKLPEAQQITRRYQDLREIESIPDRLRWLRHKHALTQKAAASVMGVSQHTYANLEAGVTERYPLPAMDKLAKYYGIPVTELLDEYNLFLYRGQRQVIQAYREWAGLDKREFAERIGVTPSVLWRWEDGNRRVSKRSWERHLKDVPGEF